MQWPLRFNMVNVTSQIRQRVLAPRMCGGQRFPPYDSGRRFSCRDFTGYLRAGQQKKHSRQQGPRFRFLCFCKINTELVDIRKVFIILELKSNQPGNKTTAQLPC